MKGTRVDGLEHQRASDTGRHCFFPVFFSH